MQSLNLVDLLGDLNNLGNAALQACRERGLNVGLFLENECGEQCDNFFGFILGEDVL